MCIVQSNLLFMIIWIIYLSGIFFSSASAPHEGNGTTAVTLKTDNQQDRSDKPILSQTSFSLFTENGTTYFNETSEKFTVPHLSANLSRNEVDLLPFVKLSTQPPMTDMNITLPFNASCNGNSSDVGDCASKPENLTMYQSDYADFGLRETAGFVAIGFLVFSALGYVGFVLWRRYLQNKYGNGQTLITEDVYDVSDLRYFEI